MVYNMEAINQIIQYCYAQGWSDSIYNSILIVAYSIQMVYLIFYRKKYEIPLWKAVVTLAIVFPAGNYLMLFLTWVENGFQNWGANNIIRIYVYMPLIAIAVAKLLKVSSRKMIDFLAPSMALEQAIGHTVCPFAGCCHGYACSWGIWNPQTDTYLFPNQWLECLVAFAVFLIILYYAKRKQYKADGSAYAMFLVLFGGTRFLLEFLRDNDKLFLGISNLALHALFMVLVGTIWLMVLAEKEKQSHLSKNQKKQTLKKK